MVEIEISEEAREVLLARLEEALEGRPELRRRPVGPGLKLYFRKKGAAYLGLSFPAQGDRIEIYKGKSVLIVSPKDMEQLAGTCLLVRRQGNMSTLALERPNGGNVFAD